MNIVTNTSPTVQLQGIGRRPAVRARELKPGMRILWNFGYSSTVVSVIPSGTGKSVTLTTRKPFTGKIYTRRTTSDRLFAID